MSSSWNEFYYTGWLKHFHSFFHFYTDPALIFFDRELLQQLNRLFTDR